MGIVNNKQQVAGAKPLASELNEVYDQLALANVDAINTDREWAGREHLDQTSRLNDFEYFSYVSPTTFSTTSFTEVQMMPGGTRIRVQPNYTPTNDFILRVQCDGTIDRPEQTVFGASTANPLDDLYQFIIKVTTNTGTENIAYANYSFSKLAYATTAGAPAAFPREIWYRNFNISAIKAYPAGTTIQEVAIWCKVGNTGNTLNIGYAKVFTHIMEN